VVAVCMAAVAGECTAVVAAAEVACLIDWLSQVAGMDTDPAEKPGIMGELCMQQTGLQALPMAADSA
jgi:hypothetical protein